MRKTNSKRSIIAIILSLTLFFGLFINADPIFATSYQTGVVTTKYAGSTVNIRSSASSSGTKLCALSQGTKVTVLSQKTGSDSYTWYYIQYTNPDTSKTEKGYIRGDYITIISEGSSDDTEETAMSATGKVNANNVFVRKTAGTDGTYILSLYVDDAVTITGKITVSGATWYHVSGTKDGTAFNGYAYGSYITVSEASSDDDSDYAQTLRDAGFPESYIAKLTALHTKYPKWSFVPVQTGLDWSTAVKKESVNGINLVSKTADDSKKSTASGAYDWTTNTWTIYDGSGWVAANPDYIAYYMDPRNFLDENSIFQFESLSYQSGQNLAGVNAIVKGTFLANSVKDSDGTTLSYPSTLITVGKATGVSPYHLASKLRQEQGVNGTSAMISGTYSGYKGYYNYFNIGASGSGTDAVLKSGLSYAKNAGWNTRYKSISGGATIIGNSYIKKGQDTEYFQKFNVVNSASGLYSHQYMQNVTGAYDEGISMAKAYTDKSQSFVFRIPVYKNMPSSPVTFTASGNPNNYLKSLSVSGLSLTPAFAGATTSYSLVVANSVSSITVNAAAVVSTSTVSGTGSHTLAVGNNTITVKCKSQSGSTKTYTLTVYRQEKASDDTDYSVTSSTYTIGKNITGVAIGTKAADFLKKFTATNCTIKLLDASGKENSGKVGTGNKLAVYVNGTLKATYSVVIYGDVNGDGSVDALDLIKINRHILQKSSLTGVYLTAADANRKNDGVNALDLIVTNNQILGKKAIVQK